MIKLTVVILILLTITACGSSNPSGFYECRGVYKSLDFDNGKVIVDLGFIKHQGTYEVNGHNVILTLDGKTLVLESISNDNTPIKIRAEDFTILASPMINCANAEEQKLQRAEHLKTPEGKAEVAALEQEQKNQAIRDAAKISMGKPFTKPSEEETIKAQCKSCEQALKRVQDPESRKQIQKNCDTVADKCKAY